MFRRLLIAILTVMLLGASAYGQTPRSSPPKKLKVKTPKKVKSPPVKRPKDPPLTAQEKAVRKANLKLVAQQRKAFEKQKRLQEKDLKAQQAAYVKQLRTMEKQSKRK
jgi:hypothetical protein